MSGNPADILAHSRFFAAVRGQSLQKLRDMAIVRRFPAGTMIFREGEPCAGMFIVGSGLVRIFKTAPSGKEHVLHLVSPGGTFAEVAAIGEFAYPAFAEALEDTVCAVLPAERFGRALREDHELCLQLLGSMAWWVKQLVTQLEDIALRDAAGRVARYLLSVADAKDGSIHLPSLKKHLASHLNLTSETLSRTLRRLTETGLIADDGEGLVVKDRGGMVEASEGMFPVL